MALDFTFLVGGEAGQGVQSLGFILAKALSRRGLYIFASQDYESRIRGGHNALQIRVGERPLYAPSEGVHLLVALNRETIELHQPELVPGGLVIFDHEKIPEIVPSGDLWGIPLERLAQERAGGKLMANSVAIGAAAGVVDFDFSLLEPVIRESFAARNAEVVEGNVRAASAGYDYARQNYPQGYQYRVRPGRAARRMLINGNEAVAIGAVAAGCKFMCGYPMSPSTPIMEYFAKRAGEFGLVMQQMEDEIAVVNAIIGASFVGARAMAPTSGGGFCLMVEGLGLAGITETPIVIVNGQRGGPATGLPTKTEQGDLDFVLHAAHGEFPRAVFCPGTAEEAFHLTIKAFNVAERYQVPVIILTDVHLVDSYQTVERFDLSQVKIDRGLVLTEDEAAKMGGEYRRHQFTDSGISPRALPGYPGILVVTTGDEHTEDGHTTERADIRVRMMQKRLGKLRAMAEEVAQPTVYGSSGAGLTLVGWGSTYGAMREAVDMLVEEGVPTSMVHLGQLWPFPSDSISTLLDGGGEVFVVENNATGQLARLIKRETGKSVTGSILKYDGRPFLPAQLVKQLKEVSRRW